MKSISFSFMLLFVSFLEGSSAPHTVPYRYPTSYEITTGRNITFSSEPITESDIFIERGVLEFLVNNSYLNASTLNHWNRISQLSVLNPYQAIRMMRIKRKEARALRRFQRANGLPQTGVIDSAVVRIVFPITCGTTDFIEDEQIDDGFGHIPESLKKR
jgi:hypothetical protein